MPERRGPIEEVLRRIDLVGPSITGDERLAMADDDWSRVSALGIVREAEQARVVSCDDCGDPHREHVRWMTEDPGEPARPYIRCDDLWIAVDPERLRQWAIDMTRFVELLTAAVSCAGRIEELVPGRLWLLGRTAIGGRSREIFFGRRLARDDGAAVVGSCVRFQGAVAPVVLIAGVLPGPATWAGSPPTVLTLTSLVTLQGEELVADRAYVESALDVARSARATASRVSFPRPPGVTWDEVRIVVADLALDVIVRGKRIRYTFAEAGFEEERRGGVPDQMWRLLSIFALRRGVVPFDDENLSTRDRDNLKKLVSELRRRLRALLQIEDDPFHAARGSRRYEARFAISTTETVLLPTPAGIGWEDLAVHEIAEDRIAFTFATTDRRGTFSSSRTDDDVEFDVAEVAAATRRAYDLVFLGLADRDGAPTPTGLTLRALLRAGGTLVRPATDPGMLALGALLSKMAQIPSPAPFSFEPRTSRWTARFEASSALAAAAR